MKKIASFQVDHTRLVPGLYVSRKDCFGDEVITTFDLRFKKPNSEALIGAAALHTIEHLGATFLRNHPEWAAHTVYFGPMGCRTGFYMVLNGDLKAVDVLPLVREMLEWMTTFAGPIPGASPAECGNYSEQNLDMAQAEAAGYLEALKKPVLDYPNILPPSAA